MHHSPLSSSLIPPSLSILFEVIYDTSGSRRWLLTTQRLYCLPPYVCARECVQGCERSTPLLVSLSVSLSCSLWCHKFQSLNDGSQPRLPQYSRLCVCHACVCVCSVTIQPVEAVVVFLARSFRVAYTRPLPLITCLTDGRRQSMKL